METRRCGNCDAYVGDKESLWSQGYCSTRDIDVMPGQCPDLGDYCGCPYFSKCSTNSDDDYFDF